MQVEEALIESRQTETAKAPNAWVDSEVGSAVEALDVVFDNKYRSGGKVG